MLQLPELVPASAEEPATQDVIIPHGIPRRVEGAAAGKNVLTPFEGLVYSLVDGQVSASDVVAASGLSPGDAVNALERLTGLGLVTLRADGAATASPQPVDDGTFGAQRTEAAPRFGKTISGSGLAQVPLKKMTAAEAAQQMPALLRAVREAWAEGDIKDARARLKQALQRDPEHAEALALHDLFNAPHMAQQRARALVDIGIKAERRRAMADAVMLYDRALEEFEPSAVLHHRVALCMLHAGLPPREAVPHALRAVELVPDNPRYKELLDRLNAWKPG